MNFKRLIPLFKVKNAFKFSNLKNRLFQLRAKTYNSLAQLHQDMEIFQHSLSYNQWLKYQKLTQEMDKKYRKIRGKQQNEFNFTLTNTITSEYFYQKDTAYTYYKQLIFQRSTQPQLKTLSPSQLNRLTKKYVSLDMQCYHKSILPTPTHYNGFMQKINHRYQNVEQILCRHIFKGYEDFSTFQQNLFFKKQTKYKGDFKFQIVQNLDLFEQISPIIKNVSLFNQCRSKVQLASQLILTKYWKLLSEQSLANYLFSVSLKGKQLQEISTNFGQVCQRLPTHIFQLLFYTSISGCQSQEFIQKIQQFRGNLQQLTQFQYFIYKMIIKYNQKSKNLKLSWADSILQKGKNYEVGQNDMLKAFIRFLQEKHYEYKLAQEQSLYISPNKILEIQDKKFICLTHLFYNQEGKPNGLYSQFGEKIKFMNPHEALFKETLNKKQEYMLSKMKGIKKPNYKKPSKFDYYTLPQQIQQQRKQKQSESQK